MCLINFRQGPNGSTGEEEGIYISARIIVHLTAFTLLAKRGEKTERLVQCWDVVEGEDFFFFLQTCIINLITVYQLISMTVPCDRFECGSTC